MSDLISRQGAIDALGEKPVGETDWDLGCRNQWEWDTEILRTLPSTEPERKWIPVTEALPEEDGMLTGYLVSIGNDVTIMCFVDGKFVSWVFADNKLVEKQFPVSAWMPLPEPYGGN